MRMPENSILQMLRDKEAYLEGHFLLSSGLHSPRYIQCAQVLKYPGLAEQLGAAIASFFHNQPADIVISPAIGGIIIGYEVARSLGVAAIFCERSEGEMKLRRGFEIISGEQVLVVEDVITTGKSTKEVIEVVRDKGGEIIGVGAIVNRGANCLEPNLKIHSLISLEIPTYKAEECPLCGEERIPLVKPGSRNQP